MHQSISADQIRVGDVVEVIFLDHKERLTGIVLRAEGRLVTFDVDSRSSHYTHSIPELEKPSVYINLIYRKE